MTSPGPNLNKLLSLILDTAVLDTLICEVTSVRGEIRGFLATVNYFSTNLYSPEEYNFLLLPAALHSIGVRPPVNLILLDFRKFFKKLFICSGS